MHNFTEAEIIIFDNDGTLIPSHEVANPAIQKAFALFCEEKGIDLDVPSSERLSELTGQPGEVFYESLLPVECKHLSSELRSLCLDHEVEWMLADAHFYPEIEQMLLGLRSRGARTVVATHGGERYIGAVGQRLRYDALMDRVYYYGYEGMTSKADMSLRAIAELGPGSAVFIGDRHADAVAAVEAGIPFIGCLYGYGSSEELLSATALAATPSDLARLLLGNSSARD